jgi:hypothetical protein
MKAVKEWGIRYPPKRTEEEIAYLAVMYYEDLVYAGIGEREFEILKREVNCNCKWFPQVSDIIEQRLVFVERVHEPTEHDRLAASVDPSYQYGKRKIFWKKEMMQQIALDYEDKGAKQLEGPLGNPGGLLKSIPKR